MKKLIIKEVSFGSENLLTYTPEHPENFCIWLSITIGSQDEDGSHLFQAAFCSVTWLAHKLSQTGVLSLKHMFLVEKFDINQIKTTLEGIAEMASRPKWDESLRVLVQYFEWEFDGCY